MIELELPWPPTVNTYWRRGPTHTYLSKKGRAYKEAVKVAVLTQLGKLPFLKSRLSVSLHLYPPDKRKRDIDNHVKAVLDSLTESRVWHDDEQVDELQIVRGDIVKGGMAKVVVRKSGES